MTLRMSANGRAQLIVREGSKTHAYRDSVGVWTIGTGHTSAAGEPKVTPDLVITKEQIDEILSRDLHQFEDAINEAVRVPLTQGQFDALCSLAFNIGVGAFKGSTVVKRLNKRDYAGAAKAFLMWNKPPEIRGRRESERKQFVKGTIEQVVSEKTVADQPVTVRDLRQAGSRTIAGADQTKSGLGGLATAAAGATAVASQVQDVAGQVQSAADSVQSATGALVWAQGHWKLIALAALLISVGYFAWRIWSGASLVQRARVDDAQTAIGGGA